MIARISVWLILALLLPDVYFERVYICRSRKYKWLKRLLLCGSSLLMVVYTLFLSLQYDFAPHSVSTLNIYLLLTGIYTVPKLLFAVCSLLGWGHCRYHHTVTNWGNYAGAVLAIAVIALVVYGSTWGFNSVVVRHETFYSKQLPASFDGYKIVQFSDAHVGTYDSSRQYILKAAVDSINAQQADVVCFTGDLQNMRPIELQPVSRLLSSIKAPDGVYSVLGNHDYADYTHDTEAQKKRNEQLTMHYEQSFGWQLLNNEHVTLKRDNDSIIIAGMENDGKAPFPSKGNILKALKGTAVGSFKIMLEHDPSAWDRKILPQSDVQLTLSGHTHAMQFKVLGWSPAALLYKEWGGMYQHQQRAISVSTGVGGFIPFRVGVKNEIVVITLRRVPPSKQ